jgi:site-specific DNA-methyltransferase (adenine-specific)
MNYQIINQDSASYLATLPDNSIDAVVTDPPYGIDFLGKAWDSNTGEPEIYRQCYRVLKPGGHILAFSAARTYHHLAMSIEQAGFEIRDQIMWIYGSGFPKSQDVGKTIERQQNKRNKGTGFAGDAYTGLMATSQDNVRPNGIGSCGQCGKNNMAFPKNYNACEQEPCFMREQARPANNEWAGWGTNLKPAHEPICMARKPMRHSVAQNVQEWGVGAINVDATRIAVEANEIKAFQNNWDRDNAGMGEYQKLDGSVAHGANQLKDMKKDIRDYVPQGRFPANIIHDGSPEVVEHFPDNCGNMVKATRTKTSVTGSGHSLSRIKNAGEDNGFYDGLGSAARFFYCAKVSRAERHAGYDTHELGNNHPTVKPVDLMRYLIRLVTPPGGTVLDPFCGSGSTGMAAVELGHTFIGIEREAGYAQIAETRIAAWHKQHNPLDPELFEVKA